MSSNSETLLIDNRGGVYLHDTDTNTTTLLADYTVTFTDIAVTPDGSVYANSGSTLYRLNLEAGTLAALTGFTSFANGLGSDDDGNLYVSFAGVSAVQYYDLNATGTTATLIPGRGVDFVGFASGSAGDVHYEDGILYYLSTGRELIQADPDALVVLDRDFHNLTAAYGLHIFDDNIYAFSGDDVYLLDPDSGSVRFEFRLGDDFTGVVNGAATTVGTTAPGDNSAQRLSVGFGSGPVDAGGGDDTVQGSLGSDVISAGAGNDQVFAGSGDDAVSGGTGRDLLAGALGDDTLAGDADADRIFGGAGHDSLMGGAGDDLLGGSIGNDTLQGGTGNDEIYGAAGDDSLQGGDGNDTLGGTGGNDTASGGAGDDAVWGSFGNDSLSGGTGRDTLGGFSGDDTLSGDAGADELWGADGTDQLFGGAGDDSIGGGAGFDVLLGGTGDDRLSGGAGGDFIDGEAGDDTIFGFTGNDTIAGYVGDDLIYGGDGADSFLFFAGDGRDDIRFFRADGGDTLVLSQGLWDGTLDEQAVVDTFGRIDANGNAALVFDADTRITLTGLDRLDGLADAIDII